MKKIILTLLLTFPILATAQTAKDWLSLRRNMAYMHISLMVLMKLTHRGSIMLKASRLPLVQAHRNRSFKTALTGFVNALKTAPRESQSKKKLFAMKTFSSPFRKKSGQLRQPSSYQWAESSTTPSLRPLFRRPLSAQRCQVHGFW